VEGHVVVTCWGSLPHCLGNYLTDSSECVRLMCMPCSTPSTISVLLLVLISVRGWVNSRALYSRKDWINSKNPFTSSGLKTAIFRLVA
jgi:hypothetical protein